MRRNVKSAFTLVEVLTGIIVIAAISTCSWFAASTLFRGEQLSRNRTVAINLLQKSQEEMRKASLSFYDSLENCQFPGPAFVAGNLACGLQPLGAQFNGYDRSVVVTPQNSSTELKKAVITVTWTDQGVLKSLNSAVLLARPPDPLPGNIIGTVRSSATGNALISNAQITVTLVGNTTSRTTTSKGSLGTKSENFDFYDSTTGAFVLPVGTWKLTATHPSYYNYAHTVDITVTSNAETTVDFLMDPKPKDAKVTIKVKDMANGASLIPNFESAYIYLIDDFTETGRVIGSVVHASTLVVTVPFNDVNPKKFTVVNNYAYRAGYAAKTNSLGPPSCTYNYQPHGWSSAVEQADASLICTNPFNGSIATDRIIVNPGDDFPVDVPLYPVPMATVKGKVVDSVGNGLAGAVLYARWPDGNSWWRKNSAYITTTTDASGNYNYLVPAVQEMFANNGSGALTLRAEHNMPFTGCCDSPQQVLKYSYLAVTNLFEGSTVNAPDMVIPDAGNLTCGNVKGVIKDGSSGAALNGAGVNVQGVGTNTAGAGDYIYQCASTGYRLPVGLSRFYASLGSYYGYDSAGNYWYSPAPSVNIKTNLIVDYDAKLWPVGAGKVIVNVLDAGTNFPISGAKVRLQTYNGGDITLTTVADGKATFNNTLETWPPVGLPGDPYYNQTPRGHALNTTHPSGFYSSDSRGIPILQKGDTLTIDVKLTPSGGT
ncbi:MAG: hypothetical protein IT395_06015 [Candidatus Omnitrophica bacterium]|nr:hypothetical protein [Candidatus Omnitrophota bacterium]